MGLYTTDLREPARRLEEAETATDNDDAADDDDDGEEDDDDKATVDLLSVDSLVCGACAACVGG